MTRALPGGLQRCALIGCVAFLAAAGHATDPVVSYTFSFTELEAGTLAPVANPNGILEPGEALRLDVNVTFDPPVHTFLNSYQSVAGLAFIHFHLHGTGGAQGVWSHLAQREGWAHPAFPVGTPSPDGTTITGATAGQLGIPFINPMNPIDAIWTGIWTPDSYSDRSVTFSFSTGGPETGSSIWVHQPSTPSFLPAQSHYTPKQIQIIPAPATLAFLSIAGLAAFRRRR